MTCASQVPHLHAGLGSRREIEHLLVRFSKLLVRSGLAPEATWVVDEAEAIIDTTALGNFIGTLDNKSRHPNPSAGCRSISKRAKRTG